MLNLVTLKNLETNVTYDVNTDIVPLTKFDPKIEYTVTNDRKKPQFHGVNPAFGSRGGMTISMEGDIFGNDSADYFTNREDLLNCLHGGTDPDHYTDRSQIRVILDVVGSTENWYADGTIQEFDAPLEALSPSRTTWMLTVYAWLPFWSGLTTPTNRYYY